VTAATGVTQLRVVNSEWIKFRTVRSTMWTLLIAAVSMVGFGMFLSWAFANRISDGRAEAGAGTSIQEETCTHGASPDGGGLEHR
jgi:hypothetical protein